jgi:hypothetical protein
MKIIPSTAKFRNNKVPISIEYIGEPDEERVNQYKEH